MEKVTGTAQASVLIHRGKVRQGSDIPVTIDKYFLDDVFPGEVKIVLA